MKKEKLDSVGRDVTEVIEVCKLKVKELNERGKKMDEHEIDLKLREGILRDTMKRIEVREVNVIEREKKMDEIEGKGSKQKKEEKMQEAIEQQIQTYIDHTPSIIKFNISMCNHLILPKSIFNILFQEGRYLM